jgi:hypothetical protein
VAKIHLQFRSIGMLNDVIDASPSILPPESFYLTFTVVRRKRPSRQKSTLVRSLRAEPVETRSGPPDQESFRRRNAANPAKPAESSRSEPGSGAVVGATLPTALNS